MKRTGFLPIVAAVALILAVAPAALAATRYKYKILHTFTGGSDGGLVAAPPTLDASGNVYGTTYWGGTGYGQECGYESGCGVIFKLSPNKNGGWKENVLLDLEDDTGGAYDFQPLLFDGSGNLFGSTTAIDYKAYIFELTPGSGGWQFNPIYEPAGYCLVFDQSGDLYGCMDGIFELSPGQNGWTYTNISEETTAYSPLSWDAKGNLYGTNQLGGHGHCSGGCGYAWQLTPRGDGTWTYHVIFYFGLWKNDGVGTSSGLVLDAAGNAYGVTGSGGDYNCGIVYELEPPPPDAGGYWREKVLYDFGSRGDCAPFFNLAIDGAGSLYGVALGGDPTCGCGVIFKLAPQKGGKWKYSLLHTFHGPDGGNPNGVVLDGKGNIFGTASGGGKYDMGVAFEISP
jgi:hypothetical protein